MRSKKGKRRAPRAQAAPQPATPEVEPALVNVEEGELLDDPEERQVAAPISGWQAFNRAYGVHRLRKLRPPWWIALLLPLLGFIAGVLADVIGEEELGPVWREMRLTVLSSLLSVVTTPVSLREFLGVLISAALVSGLLVGTARLSGLYSAEVSERSLRIKGAVRLERDRQRNLLRRERIWQRALMILMSDVRSAASEEERAALIGNVVKRVLIDLRDLFPAQTVVGGSVMIPDGDYLRIRWALNVHESRLNVRKLYIGPDSDLKRRRGVAGCAWRDRLPVLVPNIYDPKEERYFWDPDDTRAEPPPYRSILAVPILREEKPIAVLCVDGAHASCFHPTLGPMLGEVAAGYLACALHSASLANEGR